MFLEYDSGITELAPKSLRGRFEGGTRLESLRGTDFENETQSPRSCPLRSTPLPK